MNIIQKSNELNTGRTYPTRDIEQWKIAIRIRMIKDLAMTGGIDSFDYQDMKSEDFHAAKTQIMGEYKGKIGKQ